MNLHDWRLPSKNLVRIVSVVGMPDLEMFPANPDYIQIHTRRYEVRAFHMAEDRLMLRGVVVDEKPVGLYIEKDPDPLWMHHMILDLEIHFPSLVIQKATATFREHPHLDCVNIDYPRVQRQGTRVVCRPARMHAYHRTVAGNGTSRRAKHVVDARCVGSQSRGVD